MLIMEMCMTITRLVLLSMIKYQILSFIRKQFVIRFEFILDKNSFFFLISCFHLAKSQGTRFGSQALETLGEENYELSATNNRNCNILCFASCTISFDVSNCKLSC